MEQLNNLTAGITSYFTNNASIDNTVEEDDVEEDDVEEDDVEEDVEDDDVEDDDVEDDADVEDDDINNKGMGVDEPKKRIKKIPGLGTQKDTANPYIK